MEFLQSPVYHLATPGPAEGAGILGIGAAAQAFVRIRSVAIMPAKQHSNEFGLSETKFDGIDGQLGILEASPPGPGPGPARQSPDKELLLIEDRQTLPAPPGERLQSPPNRPPPWRDQWVRFQLHAFVEVVVHPAALPADRHPHFSTSACLLPCVSSWARASRRNIRSGGQPRRRV